jgi:hypothetical protein
MQRHVWAYHLARPCNSPPSRLLCVVHHHPLKWLFKSRYENDASFLFLADKNLANRLAIVVIIALKGGSARWSYHFHHLVDIWPIAQDDDDYCKRAGFLTSRTLTIGHEIAIFDKHLGLKVDVLPA